MDKIIVSNRSALSAKYGAAGLKQIKAAVTALINADAKRGLKTRLVFLDIAADMKKFKGKAVTSATATRENKEAIDAIFKAASPEYLMILGAPDVVPHQDLTNPLYKPSHHDDDPDKVASGDLPYACDAPYSRDIASFKGPTRVVGRLPDLTKDTGKPTYLLALLKTATTYTQRKVSQYNAYFGLSASVWNKSSEQSLGEIFGGTPKLFLSPPSGPKYGKNLKSSLSHFINCHGGSADPNFYGQKGNSFPESLTSKGLVKKIAAGTVIAAECCYGAQMYDSITLAIDMPISQRYLIQGAYGFFGSSTIAYGPAVGNGAADYITQFFLKAILEGASLGRAALLARQQFVAQTSELDPTDLKTLGQFSLLGDPAITPAIVDSATTVPKGIDVHESARQGVQERRAKMVAVGKQLQETKPTASRKSTNVRKSASVSKALANIAREAKIGTKREFTPFDVKTPKGARPRGSKSVPKASRYFVAVHRPKEDGPSVVAVAKEVSGRIVGYRIYEEKSGGQQRRHPKEGQ